MTAYPPERYVWLCLISQAEEGGQTVKKNVLVEIGWGMYLKSNWGWARACWVQFEATRPALPLLS